MAGIRVEETTEAYGSTQRSHMTWRAMGGICGGGNDRDRDMTWQGAQLQNLKKIMVGGSRNRGLGSTSPNCVKVPLALKTGSQARGFPSIAGLDLGLCGQLEVGSCVRP
ncbi:hypothetical protein CRG98_017027 [Punica granatum]|uniref:Uncharacterized protein n=1 Tax=Punica granatum TaxID=22663 RepID=A0A2I0K221_PUNGR|nr:hypothetical protein CRG98_017027 [Punica granatum]